MLVNNNNNNNYSSSNNSNDMLVTSNIDKKENLIMSNGGKTDLENTQPCVGGELAGHIKEAERSRGGEEARFGEGEDLRKETGPRVKSGLMVGALGGGEEKFEFNLCVSLVLLLWSVCGLADFSKVLKTLGTLGMSYIFGMNICEQ